MEVGQGPNWGCSAKEIYIYNFVKQITVITDISRRYSYKVMHTQFFIYVFICCLFNDGFSNSVCIVERLDK
jgi:hypothetical protein